MVCGVLVLVWVVVGGAASGMGMEAAEGAASGTTGAERAAAASGLATVAAGAGEEAATAARRAGEKNGALITQGDGGRRMTHDVYLCCLGV